MEYRTLAKTIMQKMTVAIPATSMVKARCGSNGMRHFWRLSSDGSIDLRQESRVAPPSLARLSNLPIMIERHPSGFIEPCPLDSGGLWVASLCRARHEPQSVVACLSRSARRSSARGHQVSESIYGASIQAAAYRAAGS